MTDQVKLEFVPAGAYTRFPCTLGGWTDKEGMLIEVTEGDYKGFRVSPNFLRKCADIDSELDHEASRLEQHAKQLTANAAGLRALKGGRLVLPTWQEYLAACDAHERELRDAPVRKAEEALAKVIAAGGDQYQVSYAKIFLAVMQAKRDAGDEREIDVPASRQIELDATSDNWWSEEQPRGVGVPVRLEVDDIGIEEDGNIVVVYNIMAPMPVRRLAPRKIGEHELSRLCRAVGIKQLSDLDDVRFLPFVVSMDDRADVVTWYYPDNGDLPDVQVFEKYQRPWVERERAGRPWGSPPAQAA